MQRACSTKQRIMWMSIDIQSILTWSRGLVVVQPNRASQKLLLSWDFHTLQAMNGVIDKKISSGRDSCG